MNGRSIALIAISAIISAAAADEVFNAELCDAVPAALKCWSNGSHSLTLAQAMDTSKGMRRVFRVSTDGNATALVIARECPLDGTVLEFSYFMPSNAPVRSVAIGMRVKEDGGRQTEVRLPPTFGRWHTERMPIARLMRGDIWRAGTARTAQSLEIGVVSEHGRPPFNFDVAHIRILREDGPCSPMTRPMRLVGGGTFAHRFDVRGVPRKSWLMALGRPHFRAMVNGRAIGSGTFSNANGWPCRGDAAPIAAEFALDGILIDGTNEVAVSVGPGDDAECAAVLGWEDGEGRRHVVATDASWLRDGAPTKAKPLSDSVHPPFWDIYPVRPPAAWRPSAKRTDPASAPGVALRSPLLSPVVSPGRWGTERRADGRWFFSTPTGEPFFLYGIQTVNCFRQNYGYLDWARRAYADEGAWASDAVAFARRLGYNAVCVAASSRSAFDAAAKRGMLNLEYVGCADGGPFLLDARGRRLVGLSDPFDAEFKRRLRRTLVVRAQEIAKRPAVFGICVGNEAHIEGNFAGASSSGYVYSEACGREFVRWLRERYGGDVTHLNRAWFGSRKSDWLRDFEEVLSRRPDPLGAAPEFADHEYAAAMAHVGQLPAGAGGGAASKSAVRRDFDAFAVHTVRAYADVVLSLMRTFFPGRLIGTNRFLGGATEEMYACWSGYDFIAVNSYPMSVWGDAVFTERQMDALRLAYRATGRPVVLTEWGVQSLDVALQSPSAKLWTQVERGRGYGKAMRQVVEELPFVAGIVAFGFQNLADSEGQGWGLVDNEGMPYHDYLKGVAAAARWLDVFLETN